MKLYLVRHGETDRNVRGMFYGWTDCDINENGVMQAKKLQYFFDGVAYDRIVASDLTRAAHTARIIAENKEMAVTYDACFRELFFGDWEDIEGSYIREHEAEKLADWLENWESSSLPGGEAFADFYCRVTEGLKKLIRENKGKTVILVSHNGPMSAMLCYLTGAGPAGFWRFVAKQGCYSSILISEKKITIETINSPA